GFCFFEMSPKEEGADAISEFNGKEVNGRALNVNEAKPREPRTGGGGGGRGGFGGGGGRGGNGGGYGGGGGGNREPRWLARHYYERGKLVVRFFAATKAFIINSSPKSGRPGFPSPCDRYFGRPPRGPKYGIEHAPRALKC